MLQTKYGDHSENLTYLPENEFKIRSAPEPDYHDGEERYIVQRLDARRRHYKKLQYFVVYKGYPTDDGQWRPRAELLETCPDSQDGQDVRPRSPFAK